MAELTAAAALVMGTGYLALGILAVAELVVFTRTRGFSRLGSAFAGMAFTCGPHHVLHADLLLRGGVTASAPVAAATLLGLVPSVVFVALRIEAATGGRGDRRMSDLPAWLGTIPVALVGVAGALIQAERASGSGSAHAAHAPVSGWDLGLAVQVVLAGSYLLVGWFLLRTQVRRSQAEGSWSLSGLTLSAVFAACALMHLLHGLGHHEDRATLAVGVAGVPAALAFLWVVHHLYRSGLEDWHRRPVAAPAELADRPSPWREEPTPA